MNKLIEVMRGFKWVLLLFTTAIVILLIMGCTYCKERPAECVGSTIGYAIPYGNHASDMTGALAGMLIGGIAGSIIDNQDRSYIEAPMKPWKSIKKETIYDESDN